MRIKDLVVDCRHAASLARFWAAVLDGYHVAPYDEAELERLAQAGITSTEDDPTVLVAAEPGALRIFFQAVPEPKTTKNRLHVDVQVDVLTAGSSSITELGGTVIATYDDHVVVADPEGNEFCLFQ